MTCSLFVHLVYIVNSVEVIMDKFLHTVRKQQLQRLFDNLLKKNISDESMSKEEAETNFKQAKYDIEHQTVIGDITIGEILNNYFEYQVQQREQLEAMYRKGYNDDIAKHGLEPIDYSNFTLDQIQQDIKKSANIMYCNDPIIGLLTTGIQLSEPPARMARNALWFCIMIWLFQSDKDVMKKSVQSVIAPTPAREQKNDLEEQDYRRFQRQKLNIEDEKIFYFNWMQEYNMVFADSHETNRCVIEFRRLYQNDVIDNCIKHFLKNYKAKRITMSYEELVTLYNEYRKELRRINSQMKNLGNAFTNKLTKQKKDTIVNNSNSIEIAAADYLVQWAKIHAIEASAPVGWTLLLSQIIQSRGCPNTMALEAFVSAYIGLEFTQPTGKTPLAQRLYLPVYDFPYHVQSDPVLYIAGLLKDDENNEQIPYAAHKLKERYLTKELIHYLYYHCNTSQAFDKIGLIELCQFCMTQYSPWFSKRASINFTRIRNMKYINPNVLQFFKRICLGIKRANLEQYVKNTD